MKTNPKKEVLPLQVLILGAAAAAFRGMLYLVAVDEKGLLARNHIVSWLLWLLCAAAAVLIFGSVRARKGSNRYWSNVSHGIPAAAGCWSLAAGIVLTLISGNTLQRTGLVRLWLIAGVLAAAGLVWSGWDRLQRRRPNLLCGSVLCLFLALHMVSRYQPWSGNPQFQDWVFSLLAAVGLTLCAYHHSAFCAGMGHRRLFLGIQLMTLFLCCAALPHTEYFALYLGGGIWVYTGLCPIASPALKKTEPASEAGTETE